MAGPTRQPHCRAEGRPYQAGPSLVSHLCQAGVCVDLATLRTHRVEREVAHTLPALARRLALGPTGASVSPQAALKADRGALALGLAGVVVQLAVAAADQLVGAVAGALRRVAAVVGQRRQSSRAPACRAERAWGGELVWDGVSGVLPACTRRRQPLHCIAGRPACRRRTAPARAAACRAAPFRCAGAALTPGRNATAHVRAQQRAHAGHPPAGCDNDHHQH